MLFKKQTIPLIDVNNQYIVNAKKNLLVNINWQELFRWEFLSTFSLILNKSNPNSMQPLSQNVSVI